MAVVLCWMLDGGIGLYITIVIIIIIIVIIIVFRSNHEWDWVWIKLWGRSVCFDYVGVVRIILWSIGVGRKKDGRNIPATHFKW